MKKTKKSLLILLLALCFALMSTGMIVSAKEVQFAESQTVNVSLDLPVEYKTVNMQGALYPRGFDTCPDSNVSSPTTLTKTPTEDYQWLRFHEATRLTESPDAAESKPGWAVIDLGMSCYVTELRTQMWNDWSFIVIAQVSENADFSDPVTIYNNDSAGKYGAGVGTDGSYVDVFTDLQVLKADSPVKARYVRVLSDAKGEGYSIFSRIEVYGMKEFPAQPESPQDISPVYASHESGNYAESISVSLRTLQDGVSIYYTLNGSFPTKQNGTLYTEPVLISQSSMLRTAAVYGDIVGEVRDYTYILSQPVVRDGENVAQNATVTAKNMEFDQEIQILKFDTNQNCPAEPESSSLVVDNSTDPIGSSTILSDGSLDETSGNLAAVKGWVVIDFGAEYSIDTIRFNWWHDWWFGDAKIELSATEDFAEAVSVYDKAEGVQNIKDSYTEIQLDTPVNARYLRATNRNDRNTGSMFTEIQAIAGDGKPSFSVDAERAVVSAELSDIAVVAGTTFEEVISKLPSEINAGLTDGTEAVLKGEWQCEGYDADTPSVYTFTYRLQDGQNICDAYNLLNVSVEVVAAADKSALNAEIGKAEALVETEYTVTTWSQMQSVLESARTVAEDLRVLQSEVDEMTQELVSAQQSLVKRADVTNLKTYTEQVRATQENEYTSSTYAVFAQVLSQAENAIAEGGNAELAQEQADALESSLRQAYEKLVKRATVGQYEELSAKLGEKKKLLEQEEKYTLSSIAALRETIGQYESILSYTDEQKADTAETVLAAACEALENTGFELRGETAELQQKYDQLLTEYGKDETDTKGYLRESWLRYIDCMVTAEKACAEGGNADLSQAQIKAIQDKLEKSVAELTPYGDRQQLEDLYEQAKGLIAKDYTEQSYLAFADALSDAEFLLNKAEDITAQDAIDACKESLESAMQGLVSIKELSELVAEAEKKEEDSCTVSTYSALVEAVEKAKIVLLNANATKEKVNEVQAALQTALNGLALRGNTDELRELVVQASACKQENYAEADWKALTAWRTYAESILNSNDADQAAVDEAFENLSNAMGNTIQAATEENGCASSVNEGLCVIPAVLVLCGAVLFVLKKGGKA